MQDKIELEELGKKSKLGKRIEKKKKRKQTAARYYVQNYMPSFISSESDTENEFLLHSTS